MKGGAIMWITYRRFDYTMCKVSPQGGTTDRIVSAHILKLNAMDSMYKESWHDRDGGDTFPSITSHVKKVSFIEFVKLYRKWTREL